MSEPSSDEPTSEITEGAVFTVFQQVLDLPADTDRSTLRYNETPRWDSLAHMSIIAGLEDRFDVMLDTDDVLDMSSFAKAIEILHKCQ